MIYFDFTDGKEHRTDMEYGEPYGRLDRSICGPCGLDSMKRSDLTVVKHQHARFPLGQVITRCPDHQRKWVART